MIEAEGFEKFCDVKFTGTKRFGLDGAESLIPALEQIIKRGGNLGVKEIVLGMPHRGRLNVLDAGDGQAAPRHCSTNSRAARPIPTRSKAPATSNITSVRHPTASSTATGSICR